MDDIDSDPSLASSPSIIIVPTIQSNLEAIIPPRSASVTAQTLDTETRNGGLPSAKQIDISNHFDIPVSPSPPAANGFQSSSQFTIDANADPRPNASASRPTIQTSILLTQPLEPVKEVATPCTFHGSNDSDEDVEEAAERVEVAPNQPAQVSRRHVHETPHSLNPHSSILNNETLPSQIAGPRIAPLPPPVRQSSNASLSTLEALQLKQLEFHHAPIAPRPQQQEQEPEPNLPDKQYYHTQLDSAPTLDPPERPTRRRRRTRPKEGLTNKIRNFFLSLRFFLLLLLVSGLVLSSVLSWRLTFTTATDSLDLVLYDYSNVLLTQFSSDFDRRLLGVEHIAFLNQRLFKNGFTDLYGHTDDMMKVFRTQIKEFAIDTTSGLSVSTNTNYLFGYGVLFPLNQDPYMVEWYTQPNHNFTQSRVDSNGVPYLIEYVAENYTSSSGAWHKVANVSDPGSSGWTKPYVFVGKWYVSFSASLYDSNKQPLGVITCDTNLYWIDHYCKQVANESDINSVFVILDANSGMILGTSLNFDLIGESSSGAFLYSPFTPTILQTLHNWIAGKTDQTPESVTPNFYTKVATTLTGEISDHGKSYVVAVKPFTHLPLHQTNMTAAQTAWSNANGVEWLLVQLLEQTDVNEAMRTANTEVLGLVIGLIVGFAAIMGLLSWYSLGSIEKLSKRLLMLSRMDFVDDRISASNASTTPSSGSRFDETAAKSFSVFSELRHMQVAGVEMVSSFKRHLLVRRKVNSMSAVAQSYQQDPSRDFRPNSPFPINISIPSPAANPSQQLPPLHAQQTSSPLRGTSPEGNMFPDRDRSLSTPLQQVAGPKLS